MSIPFRGGLFFTSMGELVDLRLDLDELGLRLLNAKLFLVVKVKLS